MVSQMISAIIPAYNAAAHIADCIRSVLDQAGPAAEIIVVNDGSTDGTMQVLEGFHDRIRFLDQPNRGAAAARNAGLRIARGDYVAFLDADDTWLPGKSELQLDFLREHPEISLVFSDEEEINGSRIVHHSYLKKSLFRPDLHPSIPFAYGKLLIENFIPTSTVVATKDCVFAAGLFDEKLRVSEDRDLWARIAARSRIACIPRVLARRRIHHCNLSGNVELTLHSRIQMWNKLLATSQAIEARAILNSLLASTHLHLGFLLLEKNHRALALKSAMRSLRCALNHVLAKRFTQLPVPQYSWGLGFALIPLSFTGYKTGRRLQHVRRKLAAWRNPRSIDQNRWSEDKGPIGA